jgi:hypothetical protein
MPPILASPALRHRDTDIGALQGNPDAAQCSEDCGGRAEGPSRARFSWVSPEKRSQIDIA